MPAGVSAYTALANVTLGSTASSVTFSSISGSYRDLVLVLDGRSTSTADLAFRVNGDTANYNFVFMAGSGSATSTNAVTSTDYIIPSGGRLTSISSNQTNCILNFMDYSTDKHKTILLRTNDSSQSLSANAARWASTSAITSIACFALGTTFTSGSNFALYGVSA
jgi:hypothetical protein